MVKRDRNTTKSFAFVCFEENKAAVDAYTEIKENGFNPFDEGKPLYVNWAEKKRDRVKKLKESYAKSVNETNVFTKNLKASVTNEDIEKYFGEYGSITRFLIKKPPQQQEAEKKEEGAAENKEEKKLSEEEKKN